MNMKRKKNEDFQSLDNEFQALVAFYEEKIAVLNRKTSSSAKGI